MVTRVMMIAGEASGDLHGAGVVKALRTMVPGIDIFGIGGENMRSEGMEIVQHISSMSFMGFVEVIRHLSVIRNVERRLLSMLDERKPDVVVLIDYPGFNLRFARAVKARRIPILYYISPQVWAWNRRRVKKIRRLVNAMKVILPFEVDLYRREGIDAEFVGHPIVERIGSISSREDFLRANGLDPAFRLLALFPGSRLQELERIMPVLVDVARKIRATPGIQVALGVAPNLGPETVSRFLPEGSGITLVEHGAYDLMQHADAAIVTSGTATLEAGWFGTPMVIVYRTSPLTYLIGRLLVNVPYIGLVNIVAGSKVVPEFVQGEMTLGKLLPSVRRLLLDRAYAQEIREKLAVIKERLGGPGASERVARGIISLAKAS